MTATPKEAASTPAARGGRRSGAWAKLPIWVLRERLSAVQLRVLIALLSFGDPQKPERPVWASPRTLAETIGYHPGKAGANRVREAIHQLADRGLVRIASPPHAKLRISLAPLWEVTLNQGALLNRPMNYTNITHHALRARRWLVVMRSASPTGFSRPFDRLGPTSPTTTSTRR